MKIQIQQADGNWRTIDSASSSKESKIKKKYWRHFFGAKERIRINNG